MRPALSLYIIAGVDPTPTTLHTTIATTKPEMCREFIKLWSCGHQHSSVPDPCRRYLRGERVCEIQDVTSTIEGLCANCRRRQDGLTRGRTQTERAYDASSRIPIDIRQPPAQVRSGSRMRLPSFSRTPLDPPRTRQPSTARRPSTTRRTSIIANPFTTYREPNPRSQSPPQGLTGYRQRSNTRNGRSSSGIRRMLRRGVGESSSSSSDEEIGVRRRFGGIPGRRTR